jgi:hypothetical protein
MIQFRTANTANIPVRASNVSIHNKLFTTNFAAVASAFTGAACSCATSTISGTTLTAGTITGTLYPGMTLKGTDVVPGTIVMEQLTGTTGATGTYRVSVSQTVASATIVGGATEFNLEGCEFRDISSILNLVTVYTAAATHASAAIGSFLAEVGVVIEEGFEWRGFYLHGGLGQGAALPRFHGGAGRQTQGQGHGGQAAEKFVQLDFSFRWDRAWVNSVS